MRFYGVVFIWMLLFSAAHAEAPTGAPRIVGGAVKEELDRFKAEQAAILCFERSRLMIFGAKSKEDGNALEEFEQIIPKGTLDYELVAHGYRMDGVLDNAAFEYFRRCLKEKM